MLSLDEIAVKHGTDKCSWGHGYTAIYESYFGSWRERFFTLLEIGVAFGASLLTWEEYFPYARVYGVDQHLCEGMKVFVGDQGDTVFLAEVAARVGPLDLVIDDGSHHWRDVETSLSVLWPALVEGGWYVIEDLHVHYLREGGFAGIPFLKERVDDVMLHGKSGWGSFANDPDRKAIWTALSEWERTLSSIHFHKNLCLMEKRSPLG